MPTSILAVFNSLIRTIVATRRKTLRDKNASPIGIFVTLASAIPLWLITLLILTQFYGFTFSPQYLFYVMARSALVIITNVGAIFFYKFQALSEYSIYGLALGTITSGLVDHFYFHTLFTVQTSIGIVLLFAAGILISTSKKAKPQESKRTIKLYQILLCMFLLSIIGVIQVSLYKTGVNIQNNPIVHGMFSQLVLYPIIAIIGFKRLQKDMKDKLIGIKDIALLGGITFIYTIVEPFIVKGLPLIVIHLLGSLQLILYTIYDLKKQEFKTKWKVISALLLAIGALILISL